MRPKNGSRGRQRGGVLITTLAFAVIIAFILAGVGRLVVAHYARARVEADYAAALDQAEAGANFELNWISQVDQNGHFKNIAHSSAMPYSPNNTGLPFATYSTTGYASNPGSNANPTWTAPASTVWVVSTGTVNGVSRTIEVLGKSFNQNAQYAVFGVNSLRMQGDVFQGKKESPSVNPGDIGSNGQITLDNNININGAIHADGPGALVTGAPPNTPIVRAGVADAWPTVQDKAFARWPKVGATAPGGLAYVQTHNNNNLATGLGAAAMKVSILPNGMPKPILLHTNVTLTCPAQMAATGVDYYVDSINMLTTGGTITLDNSNGPIRLWVGQTDSQADINYQNITIAASTSTPTNTVNASGTYNQVDIFVAVRIGQPGKPNITSLVNNTQRMDFNLYAYNFSNKDNTYYGTVNHSTGSADMFGTLVANDVSLLGNYTDHYVPGVVENQAIADWGFNQGWIEVGGAN